MMSSIVISFTFWPWIRQLFHFAIAVAIYIFWLSAIIVTNKIIVTFCVTGCEMYPDNYPDLTTHNCCPESAVLMNLGNMVGNQSQEIMFILQPGCSGLFLGFALCVSQIGNVPKHKVILVIMSTYVQKCRNNYEG